MDYLPTIFVPILLAVTLICLQEAWRSRTALEGYHQLKMSTRSNMTDELERKYTKPPGSSRNSTTWKVKALFIHPIKSCASIELDVAGLDAAGFTWDRKFAFAELQAPKNDSGKPSWLFRTLRTPGWERLTLVKPEIWLPANGGKGGWMVVRYPRIPRGIFAPLMRLLVYSGFLSEDRSFRVPLEPGERYDYPLEQVTIWRDSPRWLNYGKHLPSDFQVFVGSSKPVTLFRTDPNTYRQVYRCAPRKEALGFQPVVGFADAYPVHLLSLSSVRDIANRVERFIPKFSARRFRSNIVVEGPEAYNEDDWKKIRIGSRVFYCACHTVRCRLPNVDPDTAERHPVEPDKTLKSFRCIDEGDPLNACLGMQLVPAETGPFELRAGDEIEVLERGHHVYIKQ
jgi:uncharacterized protein YcbX